MTYAILHTLPMPNIGNETEAPIIWVCSDGVQRIQCNHCGTIIRADSDRHMCSVCASMPLWDRLNAAHKWWTKIGVHPL